MVTSTGLPPKSPMPSSAPMSSAGDQSKKKSPFKMLAGRASPFRKRFGSADKVDTTGVKEENRVETSAAEGDRDIFEEERDMYDPIDAEESHTLNTLSGSESLDTDDGETDNDESFTVDYESRCETVDTFGESTIAQDTIALEEEADEHLPPDEGKVFTQSVVLTKLDACLESGDGLVLRAQHRDMKPEQDNHAFINVRVSDDILQLTFQSFGMMRFDFQFTSL